MEGIADTGLVHGNGSNSNHASKEATEIVMRAQLGDMDALSWLEEKSKPLRESIAYKLCERRKDIIDDATSEAWRGILLALKTYKAKKTTHFFTYAYKFMLGAVRKMRDRYTHVVRKPSEHYRDAMALKHACMDRNKIDSEEIRDRLGFGTLRHQKALEALYPDLSLQQPVSSDKDFTLEETLVDESGTKFFVQDDRMHLMKNCILHHLGQKERQIIEMKFGLRNEPPMTLEEIAQEHSLTRERVRQIIYKTTKKIRSHVRFELAQMRLKYPA